MGRLARPLFGVVAIAAALVAGAVWLRFETVSPEASAATSAMAAVPSTSAETPLTIATELPPPSGAELVCEMARLGDVRVTRSGTELVLVRTATAERVNVVWPHGFTARLVGGRGEIVATDGTVVGREGDVLNLGGAYTTIAFRACGVNGRIYGH